MAVPNRAPELALFHGTWNGSQPITDEAEKHRFTAAFMVALNTMDGSGRWGRKSRVGNAPLSKDTAGYWLGVHVPTEPTDGKIHAFDLINGSTGAVHWDTAAEQENPLYFNIDARWYPVSEGGGSGGGAGGSEDLAKLRAQVEAMNLAILHNAEAAAIRFGELTARVEALEQAPVGTLPKLRAKGELRLTFARVQQIDVPVEVVGNRDA